MQEDGNSPCTWGIPCCKSHGPHTELFQTVQKYKAFSEFWWEEEVLRIPWLHLERRNLFSSWAAVSKWLISSLCFTTVGATITGALCVPEWGMTCLDVTPQIRVLMTAEDSLAVARHRGSVWINTRDTPVFDTATLSDLSTCCFTALLSNHSYFPLTVTRHRQ